MSVRTLLLIVPSCLLLAGGIPAILGQTAQEFFDRAGAGLRDVEQDFRDYWEPHVANSHRRILQAAMLCQGRTSALILGAGNCTEIPLAELADRFERVVLVDLDQESLEEAVALLPDGLAAKIEYHVSDVTSFVEPLMGRIARAVESSETPEAAFAQLEEILRDLRLDEHAPSFPKADLVVSSLVLSELHRYPRTYADRLVRNKFRVRLDSWDHYAELQQKLRRLALEDHVARLAQLRRPGGVVYFADTIARGPIHEQITPRSKGEVMLGLLPELSRQGLFRLLLDDGSLQQDFMRAFAGTRKRLGAEPIRDEQTMELLRQLSKREAAAPIDAQTAVPVDAQVAAETMVHLLCRERFPVDGEVRIFERLLALYDELGANALEPLAELDSLASQWRRYGLQTTGPAEDWWWLEYPCSISHARGAFRVRSWILQPPR